MKPPPGIVVNTRFGQVSLSSAEVLGVGRIARIFPGAKLERVGCAHCANLRRQQQEAAAQAPPEVETPKPTAQAPPPVGGPEVAIVLDFETSNPKRDSACALGLRRIEGDRIVERRTWLIRPPRREFTTTAIHGITWAKVARAPTFAELWREVAPLLEGAHYLVAHGYGFDRSVLNTCLEAARLPAVTLPWVCTVKLAKRSWPTLPDHKLPTVAAHLGVELEHHEAGSDAEVCALALLRLRAEAAGGWDFRRAA